MSNTLKLTSPICPSVNHYLGWRAIMRNGKPMAMSYETAEAKKYKKEFSKYVINEVKKQGWDLPVNATQHFYVDTIFYFDRVDKDPNNYFKLLLDTITETQLIWQDDNVTCERVNAIFYDMNNPRIEITIKPVKYVGIFPDIDHLNEFEDRCKKCKRYKRNCSILKKSIEGRIQEEINCGVCSKFTEE